MRSQSAMEFVVLSSFMFLVIVGFFAVTTSKLFQAQDEMDQQTAKDIAEFAYKEIETAHSVNDGYTRVFIMPRTINGVNYNVTIIDNRELVVKFQGHEYIKFLPSNVTGNISKGPNQITKMNSLIRVLVTSPQCNNTKDDDSDGRIDVNDPGCYTTCNYLSNSSFVQDWAESDACQCSNIGICCMGFGSGTRYALFDSSCGPAQCWSSCLGPTIFAVAGTNNKLFIQGNGSAYLRGVLQQNTVPVETADDEFIIKDDFGANAAIVNLFNGNMYIKGSLFENQATLIPPGSDDFILMDLGGDVLGYIDESGNFYLKGELTENAGALMG